MAPLQHLDSFATWLRKHPTFVHSISAKVGCAESTWDSALVSNQKVPW
jgi:hypothetical protein